MLCFIPRFFFTVGSLKPCLRSQGGRGGPAPHHHHTPPCL
jgi:hypothetical protein